MDGALDTWEEEEDEERRRQLDDRWLHFESALADGKQCQERLMYEQATGRLSVLVQRAQQRSQESEEDATDELLA